MRKFSQQSFLIDHIRSILNFYDSICIDKKGGFYHFYKDDGKIYVVDVNNTPQGPPKNISKKEGVKAISQMAERFKELYFCLKWNFTDHNYISLYKSIKDLISLMDP